MSGALTSSPFFQKKNSAAWGDFDMQICLVLKFSVINSSNTFCPLGDNGYSLLCLSTNDMSKLIA
jgi:hypothetical protein